MKPVVLGWLYADHLNVYGDRGNLIALTRRLEWRGFDVTLRRLGKGPSAELDDCDIVFIGGGQDREQERIQADFLETKAAAVRTLVEQDLVVLAVCAGFQFLGKAYVTATGRTLEGAGILDVTTRASDSRFVGDVVVEALHPRLRGTTIVGFENHGGRTELGAVEPLGRVREGFGNNGNDGTEGAWRRNVVGSYLHGSLLPRNPHLADLLIGLALARRGIAELPPLDDAAEREAHDYVVRFGKRHHRRPSR